MSAKLLLVEGLPGFGKTTTANLLYKILVEKGMNVELFLEGNLDHPADYDGVACFTKSEFESLLENSRNYKEILNERASEKEDSYFVPYQKIKNEFGSGLPDELLSIIFKNDIYELPFEKNMELITKKWAEFAERANSENKIYIFECCFIQNPITIGMIKYGEQKEKVIHYVRTLAKIIEKLNPALFYIEQTDLEFSFKKAVQERPSEWSTGFMEYYTSQGYGEMMGYNGLEGTIKVLEARREVEREIFDLLEINKAKINNSQYDVNHYKSMLIEKLKVFEIID